MMKKEVKIVLSSKNAFDAVILDRLDKNEKIAGQIKRMLYDHVTRCQQSSTPSPAASASPAPGPVPAAEGAPEEDELGGLLSL